MPLESAPLKRVSIATRISSYTVLTLAMCLLAFVWLMHTQVTVVNTTTGGYSSVKACLNKPV